MLLSSWNLTPELVFFCSSCRLVRLDGSYTSCVFRLWLVGLPDQVHRFARAGIGFVSLLCTGETQSSLKFLLPRELFALLGSLDSASLRLSFGLVTCFFLIEILELGPLWV